jgi:ankyrin repeat protein
MLTLKGAANGNNIDLLILLSKKYILYYFSILEIIVKNNNVKLCELLYTNYPKYQYNILNNNGLIFAIRHDIKNMINYFLNLMSDDMLSQRSLNTLLSESAKVENIEMCNYFIEKGANNFNESLLEAVANEKLKSVNLMIEKGANCWNAALTNFTSIEILKILIEKGANNWSRAMIIAIHNNDTKLCKFFIEKGILDGCDMDFNSGLRCAIENDRVELINLMLEKGANNLYNGFLVAAEKGNLNTLKLMKSLINLDTHDLNGGLEYAATNGHLHIIKFLIECGANDFDAVLYHSMNNGHLGIAESVLTCASTSVLGELQLLELQEYLEMKKEIKSILSKQLLLNDDIISEICPFLFYTIKTN